MFATFINCSLSTCLQHLQRMGCWMKPCRDSPWAFPSGPISPGLEAAAPPLPANKNSWWCQAAFPTVILSYSLHPNTDKDPAVQRADKDKEMCFPSWDFRRNHERGVSSLEHEQTTQTAVFFCLPKHADKS